MTPVFDDGLVVWREVRTEAKVERSDDGLRSPL